MSAISPSSTARLAGGVAQGQESLKFDQIGFVEHCLTRRLGFDGYFPHIQCARTGLRNELRVCVCWGEKQPYPPKGSAGAQTQAGEEDTFVQKIRYADMLLTLPPALTRQTGQGEAVAQVAGGTQPQGAALSQSEAKNALGFADRVGTDEMPGLDLVFNTVEDLDYYCRWPSLSMSCLGGLGAPTLPMQGFGGPGGTSSDKPATCLLLATKAESVYTARLSLSMVPLRAAEAAKAARPAILQLGLRTPGSDKRAGTITPVFRSPARGCSLEDLVDKDFPGRPELGLFETNNFVFAPLVTHADGVGRLCGLWLYAKHPAVDANESVAIRIFSESADPRAVRSRILELEAPHTFSPQTGVAFQKDKLLLISPDWECLMFQFLEPKYSHKSEQSQAQRDDAQAPRQDDGQTVPSGSGQATPGDATPVVPEQAGPPSRERANPSQPDGSDQGGEETPQASQRPSKHVCKTHTLVYYPINLEEPTWYTTYTQGHGRSKRTQMTNPGDGGQQHPDDHIKKVRVRLDRLTKAEVPKPDKQPSVGKTRAKKPCFIPSFGAGVAIEPSSAVVWNHPQDTHARLAIITLLKQEAYETDATLASDDMLSPESQENTDIRMIPAKSRGMSTKQATGAPQQQPSRGAEAETATKELQTQLVCHELQDFDARGTRWRVCSSGKNLIICAYCRLYIIPVKTENSVVDIEHDWSRYASIHVPGMRGGVPVVPRLGQTGQDWAASKLHRYLLVAYTCVSPNVSMRLSVFDLYDKRVPSEMQESQDQTGDRTAAQ